MSTGRYVEGSRHDYFRYPNISLAGVRKTRKPGSQKTRIRDLRKKKQGWKPLQRNVRWQDFRNILWKTTRTEVGNNSYHIWDWWDDKVQGLSLYRHLARNNGCVVYVINRRVLRTRSGGGGVRRNATTPLIFEHTAWGLQYQDGILATRSTFCRPPLQSSLA